MKRTKNIDKMSKILNYIIEKNLFSLKLVTFILLKKKNKTTET